MFKQTPIKQVLFARRPRILGLLLFVAVMFLTVFGSAIAGIYKPQMVEAAAQSNLNFQARLQTISGAIVPDGFYNVEFKLYNATGSSGSSQGSCTGDANCLWTETYYDSNGVAAGNDNRVRVVNGYLTVNLGALSSFPGTINWDQNLYLTMNIGGTAQTATPTYDGEMSPRLPLTAVPYAFRAGKLATFNNGTGFTSTLEILQPTGGSQIFQIQNQAAAGTYNLCIQNTSACGFATGSGQALLQGGNSFGAAVQLGSNDGNALNLATNGIVRAVLDTSGSLTFNQASSLSLATNATANGAGFGLTLSAGTANGSTTGNNGGALTLTGGNAAGSGNNNGGNVLLQGGSATGSGSGGSVVVKPLTNSSAAFQVQTSAGNQIFSIDTTGNQAVLGKPGASGITGKLVLQNASNANTAAIQSGTTSGSYTLTLPTVAPGLSQCLQNDATTIGQLTFGACTSAGGGVTTVGTIDSQTKNSNGAVIAAGTIYLQTADAANPGLVSTGTQTIAGAKTFNTAATFTPTANGAVALTVNATSGSAGTTAVFNQNQGADGVQLNTTGGGTQTNALLVTRTGATGTTTNAINIFNNGGAITNGVALNGTFTTGINFGNSTTTTDITRTTGILTVQGAGGITFTSSGGNIQIGSATTDATATLLVLDSYNTATDPTGVEGAMYFNTSLKAFRCFQNGVWVSCIGGLRAANTSVPAGNTVTGSTETNFSSNYSIPANDCQPGRVYRVTASGVYTDNGLRGMTLKVKLGTTNVAATSIVNLGNAVTNRAWRAQFEITCDTTGTTGTVEGQGDVTYHTTNDVTIVNAELANTAAVTVDTTVAQTLQLSATWNTGNAGNNITLRQFIVEAVGP